MQIDKSCDFLRMILPIRYLHEAGYTVNGQIGCTQPRRVAAVFGSQVTTWFGLEICPTPGGSTEMIIGTCIGNLYRICMDLLLLVSGFH